MPREGQQQALNKVLVERLRSCPKFECNFLFRKQYNSNDDVSDVTYEGSDFWKTEVSEDLYFAAKRFENNIGAKYHRPGNLRKESHPLKRTIKPVRCSSDPQTLTELSLEKFTSFHSNYIPKNDFQAYRKGPDENEVNDGIPKLEPISDKENSFSSSSTVDRVDVQDAKVMDDFYESEHVGQVGHSSSVNTKSYSNSSQDEAKINKFSVVKTAQSLNLYIDEYPQSGFFSLLDSLQSNRKIERIEVFRRRTTNEELRTRSTGDMEHLFHVMNNLSTLTELVLWNFHPDDLSSLCLGMNENKSLKYLQLHMECGTLDQQTIESISSMPSLLSLELEVNESFPIWSLLESESLVLLGVFSAEFEFDPNDVLRLSGKIRTNSVLQVLDIEPRIPSWCIGAVMAALRFSHTSQLEAFRFSCQNDNEEQGDACIAEILKTIEYETPLRVLSNHSYSSFLVSEEMRLSTMMAVNRNPSLREFRLFATSGVRSILYKRLVV